MDSKMIDRDSIEYIELLAEVFSEIVHKGAESKYLSGASESEVTPALMQCLQFVYLHGPCSIRRIAEGLSISAPAASQLVDRLAQKSLVESQESQEDRRLIRVDLTEAGRELVRRAREQRDSWFKTVCDGLSPERRQAMVDSLEDFIYLALNNEQDVEKACVKCGIDHLAFCVLNKAHVAAAGTPLENY